MILYQTGVKSGNIYFRMCIELTIECERDLVTLRAKKISQIRNSRQIHKYNGIFYNSFL